MSGVQTLTTQRFLDKFFGEGNQLRQNTPQIQPWIQRVLEQKDRVLLPRQEGGRTTWYALTDTARNARAFREELLAAVGPSYAEFSGLGANLRRTDPVEAAILDFYGPHAFKLNLVDQRLKETCRAALERMLNLHDSRPPSQFRGPRMPGLILRDLELAFQQVDRKAANEAIEELRAGGHLDGQNLRFLDIRRWEVFGEWGSIREEIDAGTILELRRPARITQALLRATYRLELLRFEEEMQVSDALTLFQQKVSVFIPSLLETREGMSAPEVAKMFILKAAATRDLRLRDSILEGSTLRGTDKVYLQALADLVRSPDVIGQPLSDEAIAAYLDDDKDRAFELLIAGRGGERRMGLLLTCALDLGTLRVVELALNEVEALPETEREALRSNSRLASLLQRLEERYTTPSVGVPKSWLDWLSMVSAGALDDNKAVELAQQGSEEWSLDELIARPGDAVRLAEAMLGVGTRGKQQLRLALPHLQRFLMSRGEPAPAVKPPLHSLLELYAFDETRSGSIWRAAAEVLEGLVRCGLSDEEYEATVDLLDLLIGNVLPLERVDEVLDLLETVVLLVPEHATTKRAVALVLGSLQRWWERLGQAQIELFNQLGRESGSGAALLLPRDEQGKVESSGLTWLKGKVVALYSLNERALARVKATLEKIVAGARVLVFNDKVGGGRALLEAARTADVFLIVTGAAKHAATEFIEANRPTELATLRTHAKGSASMLRLLEIPVSD